MTERAGLFDMAAWIAAGEYAKELPQPKLERTFGDVSGGDLEGGETTASELLDDALPDLLATAFKKAEQVLGLSDE